MYYYVRYRPINGRSDLLNLSVFLEERGYESEVEYYSGGWTDNLIYNALPHLRFKNEGDVIAYCLANSCTYSTEIPVNALPNLT